MVRTKRLSFLTVVGMAATAVALMPEKGMSFVLVNHHRRGPRFLSRPMTDPLFSSSSSSCATASSSSLSAKPRRLDENVEGALYVNDRCINCAACSNFAPDTFSRHEPTDAFHVVHRQPTTASEMERARAALAACPVAAIRLETKAERQHRSKIMQKKAAASRRGSSSSSSSSNDNDDQEATVLWTEQDQAVVEGLRIGGTEQAPPFPRPFLENSKPGNVNDVFWLGHHNERSFGATPYLFQATHKGESVWIMVDTPRFGPSAVKAVESLTGPSGPDYLFLTHVDDTADHQKWVDHYNNLQRIFHSGDLGRHNWIGDKTLEHVEILLQQPSSSSSSPSTKSGERTLTAYSLDGQELDENWKESYTEELVILHTPGHSPGSITLYRRPSVMAGTSSGVEKPGILFTGDSYGWTTRHGGRMTAMGRYGNNLRVQAESLRALLLDDDLDWQVIAPGHSHPKDYRSIVSNSDRRAMQKADLEVALEDLTARRL